MVALEVEIGTRSLKLGVDQCRLPISGVVCTYLALTVALGQAPKKAVRKSFARVRSNVRFQGRLVFSSLTVDTALSCVGSLRMVRAVLRQVSFRSRSSGKLAAAFPQMGTRHCGEIAGALQISRLEHFLTRNSRIPHTLELGSMLLGTE